MTTSAVKVEEYFFGKFLFYHFKLMLKHRLTFLFSLIYMIATTLDKSGATSTWQPLEWEPAQRLAIRQLMLGHTAKPNEYNVIEVSELIENKCTVCL